MGVYTGVLLFWETTLWRLYRADMGLCKGYIGDIQGYCFRVLKKKRMFGQICAQKAVRYK